MFKTNYLKQGFWQLRTATLTAALTWNIKLSLLILWNCLYGWAKFTCTKPLTLLGFVIWLFSGSEVELLRSSTARAPVHCLNQLPQGMVCWSNPIVVRQLGPLNNTRLQPKELSAHHAGQSQANSSCSCALVPHDCFLSQGVEESGGKLWEIYVVTEVCLLASLEHHETHLMAGQPTPCNVPPRNHDDLYRIIGVKLDNPSDLADCEQSPMLWEKTWYIGTWIWDHPKWLCLLSPSNSVNSDCNYRNNQSWIQVACKNREDSTFWWHRVGHRKITTGFTPKEFETHNLKECQTWRVKIAQRPGPQRSPGGKAVGMFGSQRNLGTWPCHTGFNITKYTHPLT